MKGSYADMMEVNSKSNPKSKAVLRSIEVERAANGGFIATHRFNSQGGPYKDPEQHTFGKDEGAKLYAHLGQHLGIAKAEKGKSDGAEAAYE